MLVTVHYRSVNQANSAFHSCGVNKNRSKLKLDVCDHNRWWHHLVNAYEVEAGTVLFAGKTVRSMPEHL